MNSRLGFAKTPSRTLKLHLPCNYCIDHHLPVFTHPVSNEWMAIKSTRQNLLEKLALLNVLKDIMHGFCQSVQSALDKGPLRVSVQNKLRRQKSWSWPCWECFKCDKKCHWPVPNGQWISHQNVRNLTMVP